jgi:hypothetical protein
MEQNAAPLVKFFLGGGIAFADFFGGLLEAFTARADEGY